MKPLPEKATDGRVNPRGIACLYLASHKETAALEVRPLIGSYVSVGQFEVLRDIRVVDCTLYMDPPAKRLQKTRTMPEDPEKTVWLDINNAFSKPVERGDDSLDYVPTQILAEAFKRHGFDGVAYKSSYGEEGFNVALFDIEAAGLINCGLYRIKDVSIVMEEEGNNTYFIVPPTKGAHRKDNPLSGSAEDVAHRCRLPLSPASVAMPRAFNAAAISRSDFAPAAWASPIAGLTASAWASAPALLAAWATARASDSRGLPATGLGP